MVKSFKSLLFVGCLSVAAFSITACTGSPGSAAAGNALIIEVDAGEVLQVIAPEARADAASARQSYYEAVLPRAEALGYRRLGQLNVERKVIGEYDPGTVIFFAWPNEQAAQEFERAPDWPALKATREDAWHELKIYSETQTDDLTLRFDPSKFYTLVVAWFDDEHPGDYQKYLAGIEPAVTRNGGRFIYKMRNPSFEAHASSPVAPGQLTFVEWDTRKGFENVQKSKEYADHRQYFASGLERFEFFWLAPTAN